MSVDWGRVIQNQAHGMDAFSAFYKEEQRMRKKRAEEYKELLRRQQAERERQQKNTDSLK